MWFDPRAGKFGADFKITLDRAKTLKPPDTNDWALVLDSEVASDAQ